MCARLWRGKEIRKTMEYRPLGATGFEVSAIGLGTEHLTNNPGDIIGDVLRTAVEGGISYIDLLWDDPVWWSNFEPVWMEHRKRFVAAIHWGGDLAQMEPCRQHFDGMLSRLCGGYAEVGIVTMVDTEVKWRGYAQEALERLRRYQEQGRIGAVGVSSHYTAMALKMVQSGLVDVLMVQVNLFRHHDENLALYRACADRGVGLVAMKPYAGGQVFIKTPPIGPAQCLAYVLSQPVSTVAAGVKNAEEMAAALHYWEASEEERNYHAALDHIRDYLVGDCIYCNHCLPCPQGINVGSIIQMADTAQYFPQEEIRAEYAAVEAKASACVECGECLERCPFGVDVMAKMRAAVGLFE